MANSFQCTVSYNLAVSIIVNTRKAFILKLVDQCATYWQPRSWNY